MTSREHIAQRDMVVRSLMVAPTRSERSEERPRRRVNRVTPPPIAAVDTPMHRYVLPVVSERLL